MSNPSIRLHGDAPLIDHEMLKGYCSNCKHKREWRIIRTNKPERTFVKACQVCGMEVVAKIPRLAKTKQAKIKTRKTAEDFLRNLKQELKKIRSKLVPK
jgi:hypothetical protein